MDWTDPMMTMFGLNNVEPNAQQADQVDDDDEENFYDDPNPTDETQAGSNVTNGTGIGSKQILLAPRAITAETKAENQRKAELLRAKLLAQRQNTPSKTASRSGTPAQPPKAPIETETQKELQTNTPDRPKLSSSVADLEELLNQGRAMADAKTAALAAAAASNNPTSHPQTNGVSNQKANNFKEEEEVTAAVEPEQAKQPTHPTKLNDAYYADLQAWLELTGYHDIEYRNSKLRTYRQRRKLEQEAALIAEKLEKLKQEEQESIQSLRGGTPMPTTNMAPPPLPQTMPVEKAAPQVNGTKRAHSPERVPPIKRQDTGCFRIRGANDSPDARLGAARRTQPPSPLDLERRISYPDARRRSVNETNSSRSRDPSLERRQSYYRTDFDRGGNAAYDSYTPRDPPRLPYNNHCRPPPFPSYRGSASLDLRKGGIRYFMIKSVFHENVISSQQDGLWATQEKNEQLLTDAFETSRHVILLFSVNKSMHFAGYAIMTSAPDPSLPKPSWAGKLNWGTSASFAIRWLGTTAIHFRNVGHLKNGLNLDEETGEPRAVLIGKDGQEVSQEAGMGVVWILDEAEAQEKDQIDGADSSGGGRGEQERGRRRVGVRDGGW